MEDINKILTYYSSTYKKIQVKLVSLRKKKQQHLLNIRFQKMLQIHYTQLLHSRLKWAHIRHGSFYEQDVPIMPEETFIENFRMSRQTFQLLCSRLMSMKRTDTRFRKCIPLEKRVAIALYCLKSSSEYASIAHMFGVSKASVCMILKEFCIEVWRNLSEEYLPSNFINEIKIRECVEGFKELGFPQCFGAIDGCHFEVHPPFAETSDYYNYKGWYSTILLAVVDYRYRFLYINVGCPGRCNDSSIFERSIFRSKLQDPLFKNQSVVYGGVRVPVLLIGDSAFRLSECMMKPYPFHVNASQEQKNFNYHLSKCRRVVENAFGHLKARFRRLGKGIDNKIDNVNNIIKCCCVLHNFLNNNNENINANWEKVNEIEKEQPNFEEFTYDYNPKAEQIRDSIANFLI